jgi:sialate O-acetylesterase
VPYLREQQQKAAQEIPHSGMVVSVDKGDEFTVHAPDKTTISKRLLYWALGDAYHQKGISYKSPVFESMKVQGDSILLRFNNAPLGFTSHHNKIDGFEVAGADKVFYPATAKIYKKVILLKCNQVTDPVSVRYAFTDWVVGDLYNTAGLPVAPFRTDQW